MRLRSRPTSLWLSCRAAKTPWSPSTRTQVRFQHLIAESNLPRIAQANIWESIFPKSVRQRTKELLKPNSTRPSNPMTYFIWIYILIGSQAIKILGTQNDFKAYMRKADVRIDKLREVVRKLQQGESVDVEKVLGSGDEDQEQEWEEALREIESEERIWQENKKRREEEYDRTQAEMKDANPVSEFESPTYAVPDLPASIPRSPPSQPGFY